MKEGMIEHTGMTNDDALLTPSRPTAFRLPHILAQPGLIQIEPRDVDIATTPRRLHLLHRTIEQLLPILAVLHDEIGIAQLS